jgi:hypothetical protein
VWNELRDGRPAVQLLCPGAHSIMVVFGQHDSHCRPAVPWWNSDMQTAKYVYWQDQGMWLGYFQQYPDYVTQGETLNDLQAHLRDLHQDLTSGEIPGIRRVAELEVP